MEYLVLFAFFLAAVIIPLLFVLLLWGVYRVTELSDQRIFWEVLIGLLGLLPILADLRKVRGEYVNGVLTDVWVPPSLVQFFSEWSTKGLFYLIFGLGLIMIVKYLFGKQAEKNAGSWLFAAYLMLIVPSFISAVAGTQPTFSQFMMFAPVIFTLAYLSRPSADWMWYVRQFKVILLMYVSLSAFVGIVAPHWATGSSLAFIPGFDFRLHGIFSHSNSLGMAALFYLVLDMAEGTRNTLFRKLAWLLSIGVLIATQSKTSWIGAVLAYGILFSYKISALQTNREKGEAVSLPIIIMLFSLAGIAGYIMLGGHGLESWLSKLDSEQYNSLTSLTGRDRIWEITLRSWLENPIFGYGPGLWDVDYRLAYAPQYLYIVGMAHNQLIQTLGASGVVGAIGLLIYSLTLIFYGVRFYTITRGTSLALVVVLLARSVSETPFNNIAIDLMFFIHFAVFVLFLSLEANMEKSHNLAGQMSDPKGAV